jgi:rare lipoprotein A
MGRRSGSRLIGVVRWVAVLAGSLALAHCASSDKFARRVDPRYGVSASPRVVADGEPIPKGGGVYRVGKPYVVAGQLYIPEENRAYHAVGVASWYGEDFHGRTTANGEVFDMNALSAAHPTLPMPSYVRVTNLANGSSLIVRVNDRGPYHGNRVVDVSIRAAHLLGFRESGLARVRVDYVGQAPLEGEDERMLLATLRQGVPAPAPSRVMVAAARPFVPPADEPRRLPSPDRAYGGTRVEPPPYDPGLRTANRPSLLPGPGTAVVEPSSLDALRRGYSSGPRDGSASFVSGRGLY